MAARHQHQPAPAVQRHRDAALRLVACGADHRDVGIALAQQIQRGALGGVLQVHADLRVGPLDPGDGRRQHEARLGMGGGQDQLALALATLVGRVGADVVGFGQHRARALDDFLARRGHRFQAASLAHEQQEAQFVLQLLELLGQARLGGMHAGRRQRDVEVGIGDRHQVAKLGQRHRNPSRKRRGGRRRGSEDCRGFSRTVTPVAYNRKACPIRRKLFPCAAVPKLRS